MESQEALQVLIDMQKVHDEHHNSVVLVVNKTDRHLGYGSGFIIKSTEKSALVVTCYHIVEGGTNLWIRLAGSANEHSAKIMYKNREADIVILRVQMPCKYPELLFWEKSKDVNVGKWVFLAAYFNPYVLQGLRLDSDVYPGKISSPLSECPLNPEFTNVLHSCRTLCGCSGGPLIYEGRVVGVHFRTRRQMEYARSCETFNKILKEWLHIPDHEVRSIQEMIGSLQL